MMTDSFGRMLICSVVIGAVIGVAGMYLSYAFNAASGATIVLFGSAVFCLSLLVKPVRARYARRDS